MPQVYTMAAIGMNLGIAAAFTQKKTPLSIAMPHELLKKLSLSRISRVFNAPND